jgi:hypothetical protein
MIVKIQSSFTEPRSMLIYSEDREVCFEAPLDPEVDKLLGGAHKGYFEAKINKESKIAIGKRVSDKTW